MTTPTSELVWQDADSAVEFTAELVEEYSFTPKRFSLGTHKNRMQLDRVDKEGVVGIIWNFGVQAPDEDERYIGLWFEGKKVVDYDGLFELPEEAVALLKHHGFDVSEVTE